MIKIQNNIIAKLFIYIDNILRKVLKKDMSISCTNVDNQLENLAQLLRESTRQTDCYVELLNIAEKLGLSIYEANFSNNQISGYIEVDEDNPEKNGIYVNKTHSPGRKRFTIAHEIGHYILDHLGSDCKKYRKIEYDSNESPDEIQANKFASILLMPKKLVEDIWNKFHDYKITALTFGVSEEAARYRIKNLNLVKDNG